MRYFAMVIFAAFMLASCGGGSSVVADPPVDNPPVQDPPVDNPVVKLTLTALQTAGNELDVSVTGGESPYTIKVSEPNGLAAVQTETESIGGQATFTYSAIDPVYGGGGLCFVNAVDANGNLEETDTFVGIEALPLNDDTLYAIPTKHEVKVGEPVTIQVATGMTAHPFLGSRVGVTMDGDASWNRKFRYGSVEGGTYVADGIWTQITTDDALPYLWWVLVDDDNDGQRDFRGAQYLPGPAPPNPGTNPDDSLGNRIIMDWGVGSGFPILKDDVAWGSIFTFQVSFSMPGLKHFGFQLFNGHDRTYYGNYNDEDPHYWAVLMADEMGNLHPSVVGQVDNTILVTE